MCKPRGTRLVPIEVLVREGKTCESCLWGDLDSRSSPDGPLVYICENSNSEEYLQILSGTDSCEHYSPKTEQD